MIQADFDMMCETLEAEGHTLIGTSRQFLPVEDYFQHWGQGEINAFPTIQGELNQTPVAAILRDVSLREAHAPTDDDEEDIYIGEYERDENADDEEEVQFLREIQSNEVVIEDADEDEVQFLREIQLNEVMIEDEEDEEVIITDEIEAPLPVTHEEFFATPESPESYHYDADSETSSTASSLISDRSAVEDVPGMVIFHRYFTDAYQELHIHTDDLPSRNPHYFPLTGWESAELHHCPRTRFDDEPLESYL